MTAILVGAGDIANCASTMHERTAALLDRIDGTVITMGDNVYNDGTPEEFQTCYGRSWGRHKDRTRPAPGNHDYNTPGAAGYFGYFGPQAGPAGLGYYSYFAGDWQVFSLNSQVAAGRNSAQYLWLRRELQATVVRCRIAYWHHPVFSSGFDGSVEEMRDVWRLLYEHGADVVLTGHAHDYERFLPMDAEGLPDPEKGIRQFVVGTGGGSLTGLVQRAPHSEVFEGQVFGIIEMTLEPTSYRWRFIPAEGWTFTDSGASACN
jgi:3',5'-cyclic AMP phosphodiesterase CpdA